jgi:hypothetical protein
MTRSTVRYPAAAPRKKILELQDGQFLGTLRHPLAACDYPPVIARRYYIVVVVANQDSTSSRLLPGSSYSCCIRNLCTGAQTVPPSTHHDST